MEINWLLSPDRRLTEEERALVWQKPATHRESEAEGRVCRAVKDNWNRGELKITNILLEGDAGSGKTQLAKALSADFGLPYTKVTCFADMDKSDVLGAILPVLPEAGGRGGAVAYQYYPSEIVRAYEKGWLLEIQEPTVIRDAAVLMALNSALEPDGSINLPTRIVHRHPDFIAVITTNRGYNGCRPLNEALRDRIQHAEKMDLPPIPVMVERAAAKTGCTDPALLETFAEVIALLDTTAKANAIRGVAGMRSYFFWVDAVWRGEAPVGALYQKVIYKITTDPDEIAILEQALSAQGLWEAVSSRTRPEGDSNGASLELRADGSLEHTFSQTTADTPPAVTLRAAPDSEGRPTVCAASAARTESADTGEDGAPICHERDPQAPTALDAERRAVRKRLNQEARALVRGSVHEKTGMIVHRPEATAEDREAYAQLEAELAPIIRELTRKTKPLLEFETALDFTPNRVYGTKFCPEKAASPDLRCFSQKCPPQEEPSLAVALRVDQSASMNAFGRLEAAKRAAVAVYEFCAGCDIPLLIYGDTADRSPMEPMSLYAYIDWDAPGRGDKHSLMTMESLSNNRDGMALRVLAEKLLKAPQKTKLLISLSDGQPKALPDYTGQAAVADMKELLHQYGRKGVLFLAAAIGQDKETICDIYGGERFMDITDLKRLPAQLVQAIARHL